MLQPRIRDTHLLHLPKHLIYNHDGQHFEGDTYMYEGTALDRAHRRGHVECVRLLLDRDAHVHAKDDGGTSCLAIARQRDHNKIVKLLEEIGSTE
jgi:hypothetical protein